MPSSMVSLGGSGHAHASGWLLLSCLRDKQNKWENLRDRHRAPSHLGVLIAASAEACPQQTNRHSSRPTGHQLLHMVSLFWATSSRALPAHTAPVHGSNTIWRLCHAKPTCSLQYGASRPRPAPMPLLPRTGGMAVPVPACTPGARPAPPACTSGQKSCPRVRS